MRANEFCCLITFLNDKKGETADSAVSRKEDHTGMWQRWQVEAVENETSSANTHNFPFRSLMSHLIQHPQPRCPPAVTLLGGVPNAGPASHLFAPLLNMKFQKDQCHLTRGYHKGTPKNRNVLSHYKSAPDLTSWSKWSASWMACNKLDARLFVFLNKVDDYFVVVR